MVRKKPRSNFERIVIGALLIIIALLLFRSCDGGGCSLYNNDNSSMEDTTSTTSTTTTTLEEFTCGESLQGVCEGSCPEGETCEMINILFGDTCKCVSGMVN